MDIGDLGSAIRLLMAFGSVVIIALVVLVTVIALMIVRRKATGSTAGWANQLFDAINAGNIPPQERAVLASGLVAEATILDRNEISTVAKNRTMVYSTYDFVLEVRLPGQPPYRVPCRQEFVGSESWGLTDGTVVPVRVDRANPQIVYIDREGRKQRAQKAEADTRAEHARRQAELLGRRP
jgi:hypothetical protein